MQGDDLVLLGQAGAPHGVKGEIRVKPFTGDPLALGDYGALHTADGRRLKIKRLRPAKNMLVVKFEGINSREEAQALNGTELFVARSALPDDNDEDEFYVTDLIGMDVHDENGTALGVIIAVPDFGAGPLLEIGENANASSGWLLEFSQANVPDLDLEKGVATIIRPPEVSERDED